jgi:AAA domain
MIKITNEFKTKVVAALLAARTNFDGDDKAFAEQHNLHPSVYNQVKNGKSLEGLVNSNKWLEIARKLDVSTKDRQWNIVRTSVFIMLEKDIIFCQDHSQSKICVDNTGIGKTATAKYLSRTRKNVFYVDCSQAKTKQQFVRLLAQTIGVDSAGKYIDVKANLKYYIKMLPNPLIILDEAGDLEYTAFLELKELWNATEGACGWYMMGADGLRDKISKGIKNKKVGFAEIFSRYLEKYTAPVPIDRNEKIAWYKQLITQVLNANLEDKTKVNDIVKRCLIVDTNGNIGGLRRAEALALLSNQAM